MKQHRETNRGQACQTLGGCYWGVKVDRTDADQASIISCKSSFERGNSWAMSFNAHLERCKNRGHDGALVLWVVELPGVRYNTT